MKEILGTYFEYKKSVIIQEKFVKEIGITKALKKEEFFAIKLIWKHDVALLL